MLDVYWDMQEHPDERWQTDIMYIKIRGRFFHLLIFIDEYSRYITRHALLTPMDADSVSMKAQAAIDILRRDSIAEPVIQSGNESSFSVPRNIHDRPMEVWFRKVWEHPNSYGHGYNREDMAEAVRMQGRIKGERISSPLGRIWESRADCMLRRPYRISQIPTEMQPPRCHGGGMR